MDFQCAGIFQTANQYEIVTFAFIDLKENYLWYNIYYLLQLLLFIYFVTYEATSASAEQFYYWPSNQAHVDLFISRFSNPSV